MTRTSLTKFKCSVAQTLEIIGDKWTMLIIRDAFVGVATFSGFQRNLGVARNVLADRLAHLVAHDILDRTPTRPGVERHTYSLTEKGRALFPVMIAMMQWGDTWIYGAGHEPVCVVDKDSGMPVRPVTVLSEKGHPLSPDTTAYAPGPGARRRGKQGAR